MSFIYDHFELRASFALNNMAIVMMEQGAPEIAFLTFRGAVAALQLGTDAPGQELNRASLRQSIHEAIENSSLLTAAQIDTPSALIKSGCLRVISHVDATADFNSLCHQRQQQQDLAFNMIRINEDDESLLEVKSLNLLTSIILHNFAIASLCRLDFRFTNTIHKNAQSQVPQVTPELVRRAYDDAIVILHLARNLLEEAAAAEARSCSNDDSIQRATTSCSSFSSSSNPFHCVDDEHAAAFRFSRAVCNMTAIIIMTLQQLLQHPYVQRFDEAFMCVSSLSHIRTLASVLNDPAYNNNKSSNNCLVGEQQVMSVAHYGDVMAPAA